MPSVKRKCCCGDEATNACSCEVTADPSFAENCGGCVATTYNISISGQGGYSCNRCASHEGWNKTFPGSVSCCVTRIAAPGTVLFGGTTYYHWTGTATGGGAGYSILTYPAADATCSSPDGSTTMGDAVFDLFIAQTVGGGSGTRKALFSVTFGSIPCFNSPATGTNVDPCDTFSLSNAGTLCADGPGFEPSHFPGGTATITPCCEEGI